MPCGRLLTALERQRVTPATRPMSGLAEPCFQSRLQVGCGDEKANSVVLARDVSGHCHGVIWYNGPISKLGSVHIGRGPDYLCFCDLHQRGGINGLTNDRHYCHTDSNWCCCSSLRKVFGLIASNENAVGFRWIHGCITVGGF